MALAKDALHHNLGEPVRVADLAVPSGLTEYQFRSRFKEELGVSPYLYRTQVRMAAAMNLLTESRLDAKEIGKLLGYDEEGFRRHFRLKFAMSPAMYRRQVRALREGGG